LSTAYGHGFTNRSEKMYSESQSRNAKPASLWGSGKDSSKLRRSTSVIATSFCLWSLCGGNKAGLNYLIISELSEAEMEKLEGLPRERANPSGRGRMCALCKSTVLAFICRRAYKSESELFDRLPHRNPGAEATRHQPHTKKVNP
jgi:hypothetical protein